MSLVKKFSEIVKQLRLEKGMSQHELSVKVFPKPNRQYISHLEKGNIDNITLATIEKIADALDVEMEINYFTKTDEVIPPYIHEDKEL